MAVKRKNKVNAQFNMSSLTDIIFLLLIFFMLTSSLVAPNALNLKLPGRSQSTSVQTDKQDDVRVSSAGMYEWNAQRVSGGQLEGKLRALSRKSQKSFTISPDKKAPIESVVFVMDLAMRLNLSPVLLPEK